MGVLVRTLSIVGGAQRFAGWGNTWTDLAVGSANVVTVPGLNDSSIRQYAGLRFAVSGIGRLRSMLKSTPGVWVTHNLPVGALGVNCVHTVDDDLSFCGNVNPADARFYSFTHTAGFTDLLFPERLTSDAIQSVTGSTDPDLLLVGNQAQAAGGSAALWTFRISTGTWTKIGGLGLGGSWNLPANNSSVGEAQLQNGLVYIMAQGGNANAAQVWRSDAAWTSWTKIGGDGLNGSWATGTKRNGAIAFVNGVLYAGIGGSVAGDAEAWRWSGVNAWEQIGGDGLNGSWAAGTKLNASKVRGLANRVVFGLAGAAGDSEVWQFNTLDETWTQIGGDGIGGSWAAQTGVNYLWVDRDNQLVAGCGSFAIGTGIVFQVPGGRLTRGGGNYQFQLFKVRT